MICCIGRGSDHLVFSRLFLFLLFYYFIISIFSFFWDARIHWPPSVSGPPLCGWWCRASLGLAVLHALATCSQAYSGSRRRLLQQRKERPAWLPRVAAPSWQRACTSASAYIQYFVRTVTVGCLHSVGWQLRANWALPPVPAAPAAQPSGSLGRGATPLCFIVVRVWSVCGPRSNDICLNDASMRALALRWLNSL